MYAWSGLVGLYFRTGGLVCKLGRPVSSQTCTPIWRFPVNYVTFDHPVHYPTRVLLRRLGLLKQGVTWWNCSIGFKGYRAFNVQCLRPWFEIHYTPAHGKIYTLPDVRRPVFRRRTLYPSASVQSEKRFDNTQIYTAILVIIWFYTKTLAAKNRNDSITRSKYTNVHGK